MHRYQANLIKIAHFCQLFDKPIYWICELSGLYFPVKTQQKATSENYVRILYTNWLDYWLTHRTTHSTPAQLVRTSSNEQCIPGQCHSTNNKIMVKTKNLRYRGQGQHWSWWCDIPVTEFANYSFRSRILWPRYPKLLTLVTKAEAENLRDQVQGQCYSTISKAKVKTLWY